MGNIIKYLVICRIITEMQALHLAYTKSLLITFHYDVRPDLVETTYSIVTYSSYHNCVFSLKMAYKAKTCR